MSSCAVAIFAFAATLAGCESAQCSTKNLPFRGHPTTPESLVAIIQHEARNECDSRLYDLLSEKTRAEHSRTKWRIGLRHISLPAPFDYKVVDIMEHGEFDGALTNPRNPREGFVYYNYQEPGKKKLRLKLLILREKPPEDAYDDEPVPADPAEWHVGMVDQQDAIEHHNDRYWWFDE